MPRRTFPQSKPKPFILMLRRDLQLFWQARLSAILPALFALLFATMVPLALGPERALLAHLAPGLLWLAGLLAVLLATDRFFSEDAQHGILAALQAEGMPLYQYVLARLLALWLAAGLPLLFALSLAGAAMGMQGEALAWFALTLFLGLPVLLLLGLFGAALSLGLPRGGLLLALILMPLYAPWLIFGAGAPASAAPQAECLFLAAMLALSLPTLPLTTAAALRLANESS